MIVEVQVALFNVARPAEEARAKELGPVHSDFVFFRVQRHLLFTQPFHISAQLSCRCFWGTWLKGFSVHSRCACQMKNDRSLQVGMGHLLQYRTGKQTIILNTNDTNMVMGIGLRPA